jgi:DUF4097 and DUF4098 domain-containing protein YvlB
MLLNILGMMTALSVSTAQDTTFAVSRNARLSLSNFSGEITVRVWDRSEVRIETDSDSDRGRITLHQSGSAVRVKPHGRYEHDEMSFELIVPRWLPLELSGTETDIVVEGTEASVSATTLDGDVTVRGGRGLVTATSIDGDVMIEGAEARITATSVDGDVEVIDATGDISVQSVDGSIDLSGVVAASVKANTVDGDIQFDGPIRPDGRYAFSTHDGDVTLAVERGISATITVSTFAGEFESDFPITIQGATQRERFSFTLGDGSAHVTLEAFDGTIRLERKE